jgi:hypothetical protein
MYDAIERRGLDFLDQLAEGVSVIYTFPLFTVIS